MTKKNFLAEIKQQACLTKKAGAAWDAAQRTTDTDVRWTQVEELPDCIESFANVFGISLPVAVQRKPKLSPIESLEKKIAQAEENHKHIENPEWIEQSQADIDSMKERLTKLRSEE